MRFQQWAETTEGRACLELRGGLWVSDAIERAYRAGQESVLPRDILDTIDDYQELRAVATEAVTTAPKPMK